MRSSDSGLRTRTGPASRAPAFEDPLLDGDIRQPRDWKKSILVLGLGILSWVATFVGMLELIEANMGAVDLVTKGVIGFSVAMLMVMIIWLLDQLFAPLPLITKVTYVVGYVFLTLISVGFGFGFYWKVLESRGESTRSAESAVMQVKSGLYAASARLDQLQTTLSELTAVSSAKANLERERGTSCPNSRPGDGPRRRLRDDDAARFGFASNFVKGRAAQVKTEMAALDAELAKVGARDGSTVDAATGNRNAFMRGLGRRLELAATGFNAFRTDPQLRQIRADLDERAGKSTFPDTRGGSFSCPDAQLQTALKGVVRAIDQLPELAKPQIATVEGSEAVIEAFRRLTATFYGALSFKLPPSADELRDLQRKAVQSVDNAAQRTQALQGEQVGLSRRDYIPLSIAIFVDFCLLLVSMGRPMNRLGSLVPRMRNAERGPVYQILSRFSDIHRDPEMRDKFEVFRHIVFDVHGDYYAAVPLNAPYNVRNTRYEREYSCDSAAELQREAHLLANMFASFEHERLYKRVYSPFLTTRSIQKRLWRQGSKFAGADAFRLYRFRRGVWPEIILGAVMGAYRRNQAERQHWIAENGHLIDETGTPAAARVAPATVGAGASTPGTADFDPKTAADKAADRTSAPIVAPFAPRVARNPEASTSSAAASHLSTGQTSAGALDDADLARKFGPYAGGMSGYSDANEATARAHPMPRRYGPRPQAHEEALVGFGRDAQPRPHTEAAPSLAAEASHPSAPRAPVVRDYLGHDTAPANSNTQPPPAMLPPGAAGELPASNVVHLPPALRKTDTAAFPNIADEATAWSATAPSAPVTSPTVSMAQAMQQFAGLHQPANTTVTFRVAEMTVSNALPDVATSSQALRDTDLPVPNHRQAEALEATWEPVPATDVEFAARADDSAPALPPTADAHVDAPPATPHAPARAADADLTRIAARFARASDAS